MSVISTLQNLTVSGAASTSGYALQVGEARKRATHEAHCNTAGISFVPLLFESLGGISDLASKTIRRIGRHLGQRVGAPPGVTCRQLFQKCSVNLWRGNATLWLNRLSSVPPGVDGVT